MAISISATEIESIFLTAGRIRAGKPEFANDSGYWTGGICNWGGRHNLKEDCKRIVLGLGKFSSLENLKEELQNCSSQSEFDSKKRINLNKCSELVSGLSNSSGRDYVFNICVIWSNNEMKRALGTIINQMNNALTNFKNELERMTYQTIQDISRLSLEVRKIEQEMNNLKRKAQNEKDPAKRAQIIILIEEKGKELVKAKTELARAKNILNFDADKHVADFIEAIKIAIEKRHQGGNVYNNPSDPLNSKKIDIINRIKTLMSSSAISDGQLNLEMGVYRWEQCITQSRTEVDLQTQERKITDTINIIQRNTGTTNPQSRQPWHQDKKEESQPNYIILAAMIVIILLLLNKKENNQEYYDH